MTGPSGAARRLPWPDCQNVRELGGLPTVDGARIRSGALVRADNLDRLTPAGRAALRDHGVRRIIDLRSEWEAQRYPSPFAGEPVYRRVQLIDPRREAERATTPARPLAVSYQTSVEGDARCIADVVAAIADAPPGGVVVHCASGKDRTGIAVALALHAVGVAREAIAEDYAYSAECLRAETDARLAAATDAEHRRRLRDRWSCPPEIILAVLDQLDQRYGGAHPYLRQHGMAQSQLARLRGRLVHRRAG